MNLNTSTPIKCGCGKVSGTLHGASASNTNHVVCSCSACQAYAHFLGRADDMLDAEGGSNIFQLDPKTFDITDGFDHIACMSVTPKGPLRWYADCCKTPLGNSFRRGGVPFLGVLPICIGHKGTSEEVVKLVGPVRGHVNQKTPPPFSQKIRNFFMLLRFAFQLLWWRVRGGKSCKPFFDPETLRPIKKPFALSAEEQAKLYADHGL